MAFQVKRNVAEKMERESNAVAAAGHCAQERDAPRVRVLLGGADLRIVPAGTSCSQPFLCEVCTFFFVYARAFAASRNHDRALS